MLKSKKYLLLNVYEQYNYQNNENRVQKYQLQDLIHGKKNSHCYFADCEALGVLNAM